MTEINFVLNRRSQTLAVDDLETPLLFVLSNELQLNGPKFGCGLAQCGSCTVLLDGVPIRSCTMPVSQIAGHAVITIEGLGTVDKPHPIQTAFIEEQALQCGYCLSGVVLYGKTFIDEHPNATREEIVASLNGIICRCHAHVRMVRAL